MDERALAAGARPVAGRHRVVRPLQERCREAVVVVRDDEEDATRFDVFHSGPLHFPLAWPRPTPAARGVCHIRGGPRYPDAAADGIALMAVDLGRGAILGRLRTVAEPV